MIEGSLYCSEYNKRLFGGKFSSSLTSNYFFVTFISILCECAVWVSVSKSRVSPASLKKTRRNRIAIKQYVQPMAWIAYFEWHQAVV